MLAVSPIDAQAAALLAVRTVKARRSESPVAMLSPLQWAEQNAVIVRPGIGTERWQPYPFQARLLDDTSPLRIVLKARQTGLSTAIALEALYYALHKPHDRTLFVSRSENLAALLISYVRVAIAGLPIPIKLVSESQSKLVFSNGSEIVSLPANPATGRGYPSSRVYLDEAAYMLYADLILQGVLPTLAPGGQLTVLSTPKGRTNLFARTWMGFAGGDWSRHTVHFTDCPKYDDAWEAHTRATMTAQGFAEEFGCDFIASSGAITWLREWCQQRYDITDEAMAKAVIARFLSYDTASKDKDTNAYSACVVGELLGDYRLRIRYVWRERLLMPELVARIEQDAVAWDTDEKLHEVIIEDRASGIGAYQTLMASGSVRLRAALRAFNPTTSKEERFGTAGVWVANQSVILPSPSPASPWLMPLESELFEESEFVDQRDAVAQLILFKEPYLSQGWRARQGQAA